MRDLVKVGDVLVGKYRVEKILGIGGMGMVVAATHLELDQKVALKFMLPEAMRSTQAMDRFLREAKASVRLRSEHVCRVLDVGRLENGAPYIVMEFMRGKDFADVIKHRGPLPTSDAVDYLLQALEGVAEAHANSIVHRDLKPGNLFVTTDNDGSPLVKVLDFGISKSSIAGAATKTGDIMGSPSYMAPEQMASSKNVDARADIWALGVIAYEAVTGTLPFMADTLPALCMTVLNESPPDLGTVRGDLPKPFIAVVMKCLEKKPAERYADVGELAAALAPYGAMGSAAIAARIAKVLRRAGEPMADEDAVVPMSSTNAPATTIGHIPAPPHPVQPGSSHVGRTLPTTTLSAANGLSSPDLAQNHSVKTKVGLALGAAVMVGGVIFWVVSRSDSNPASIAAPPVAVTAPANVPVPAVTAPVTKTAPVEVAPNVVLTARMKELLAAFTTWSLRHAGAPCPIASALSNVADPWGHPMKLTCADQPAGQIAGVISMGPDGILGTEDDIGSWQLGRDVIDGIRGPRWVVKQVTAAARQAKTKPIVSTGKPTTTSPASPPDAAANQDDLFVNRVKPVEPVQERVKAPK